MTDSKRRRAREIQVSIRDALIRHWDPIGVADTPEALDEYDSYIGPVYRLLTSGASDAELIEYLYKTETDSIGLSRLERCDHLKKIVANLREIDISSTSV